jgi:hypothetical protein
VVGDWRLDRGQEAYLRGATLARKPFRGEHDHCAFCWAKFVDPEFSRAHARLRRDDADVLTEGYAALATGPEGEDDYHWVCDRCYEDFRERFGWRIAAPPEDAG